MTQIHLEPKHLEIICQVLKPYHKNFYVFGSRSKGTHRPLSDLDLVCREPLSKLQVSEINEKFEESNLPFKVDLVLWDELDENFRKKISADLKLIIHS
jgi:predicted nucleotidyltransferase